MRATAPAFKRRRAYVGLRADAPPRANVTADAGEIPGRLALLDRELAAGGVDAELCVVGGAVMRLAFTADPESRRPEVMFGPMAVIERASSRVAERRGLSADWLNPSVREYLGPSGASSATFEGDHLRVFPAPPDYMFVMKVAALTFDPDVGTARGVESDIRYLLRFLEIRSANEGLELLDPYLTDRHRPADLPSRLTEMIA
jgi:hypothetical protein